MIMSRIKLIVVLLLFFQSSFSQVISHKVTVDIDKDGKDETLLFCRKDFVEIEPNEFTKFCIVNGNDTLCIDNINFGIVKKGLYSVSDIELDDRVGILHDNNKTFIWFTGYAFGSSYGFTTIAEYTGKSLNLLKDKMFKFERLEEIGGKRYFVGSGFRGETWGDWDGDYYFATFKPKEFLSVSENFQNERNLSISDTKSRFKFIETEIDVFNAELVVCNLSKENFLVSINKSKELQDRAYGIISLTKLTEDYFKKFSKSELRIIRNELFAYHGYKFKSEDLFKHFSKKSWYNPSSISAEEISDELTDIEKYNIELIRKLEK